jgi:hypothetical protein
MSTKIFNGFKIDQPDLQSILDVVRAFRPWVADQQLEAYEQFCAVINKARDREKGHPEYYADCFWPWHDARNAVKKTGFRHTLVDTDFEIIILPYKGAFYGISFVERNAWHREWLKQPGVSEFGYWNNTDQPDEISDEEWEARGKIWDEILPGAGIPSMNGFTIAIGDPGGPNLWSHADKIRLGKEAA